MKFRNEYAFLSNMHIAPFKVNTRNGRCLEFKSVENGFQYFKSTDPEIAERIRVASPQEARKLGRQCPLRSDWNIVRVKVMKSLLKAKFECNPDLAEKLMAITEPIVEENTWNDTFWGTCNGKGLNALGKLLTQIQDILLFGDDD